jgi:hypothetical protein
MMTKRPRVFAVGVFVLALATPTSVLAQERQVAFLHGFQSNGVGWEATADRLHQRLTVEPHIPNLFWRERFHDQVVELRSRPEYASLPASTVAVGHSNGGLVAREWARQGGLHGVVTLGTPHRGAPILPHFAQWVAFNSHSNWLASTVLSAFSGWTEWTWTFGYVSQAIGWVLDFNVWSVAYLGLSLGLEGPLPVAGDMSPISSYLHGLNSSDNINREISTLAARVGVVSVAHNYYFAGPARIVAPDHADLIADLLYGSAYGLLFWGNYILVSADPLDFDAMHQGNTLVAMAGHLFDIDPVYCSLVSSIDLAQCLPNDGLVPYTSQEFPSAPNLYLGQNNDGPVHTRERESSEDVLFYALVNYFGIGLRSTPPPDSGGGSGGSGSGDGGSGGSGGSSGGNVGSGPVLQPGIAMYPGDYVLSSNGFYMVVYQHDGNLVLYDHTGAPMWASGTGGESTGMVAMQHDGNLVLYDARGVPRWSSGTHDYPGSYLVVQDDGNVVVYEPGGRALWATNTGR